MIINQGLQEGLISSAPRSVTQPHQYISLSSPINIYQYINIWEEAIHDVAPFLCTRSAIACNNQIRCFVKNHPRCIQSRSKKLRNLKSDDPVVSILLSCSFFSFKSIYFWVIHIYIRQVDHSKSIQSPLLSTFFWRREGKNRWRPAIMIAWLCLNSAICIYLHKKISSAQPLFYCINNLWQLMTRAVLMKVSRKVLLWGADPLFT